MKRTQGVNQLYSIQLCNINNIMAQFIKLMIGLRLSYASAKNDNVFGVPVFPFFLLKVNMTTFVNYIIRIRRQEVPKQASTQTLVNEIDGDAADISHVLHGRDHYWPTYVGFL